MKNLSVALNIILLIAVGFLYYLHFSSKNQDTVLSDGNSLITANSENSIVGGNNISSNIFYVNTDSLWNNYELVKKEQDELALEKLKLEGQFKLKAQTLEKEFMAFQEKASKGLISEDEGQRKEAEFMQKQQQLMEYKDELSLKLVEKENERNDKIQKAIYNYLKSHNDANNYNFILGYTLGGGAMLFGNDSLDITGQIVEGLNNEYHTQNPEPTETKK